MSVAKFTTLASCSHVCPPLILISLPMTMASSSAAVIHNSIESGFPWRTPHIRLNGADRKPFILVFYSILLYTTSITNDFVSITKTKKNRENEIGI